MIQEIAAADKVKLDNLRTAGIKLEEEQKALIQQQAQLQSTYDQLEANQEQLAQKKLESQEILRQLMSRESEYRELLEEQEAEQLRLAQELAGKRSEFNQALYLEWLASQPPVTSPSEDEDSSNSNTGSESNNNTDADADTDTDNDANTEGNTDGDTDTDDNTDGDTDTDNNTSSDTNTENSNNQEEEEDDSELPTPQISGWVMPVPPNHVLSSPFGMRKDPYSGNMVMHSGIDLACPEGTPIYAGNGGQVLRAEYSSSMGNYVLIDHGSGYRTVYMHMTHSIVSPGAYVQAGQTIGYVGNTGASRGNHLHYGVSYNGTYINPYNFVYGG